AVDPAVEHGERGVPLVREQPFERRQDAIPERRDRLAAEEGRVVRYDATEGVHEGLLELVAGDVGEPASPKLLQLRPALDLALGRDDLRRLDRSCQSARDDAVEGDVLEDL